MNVVLHVDNVFEKAYVDGIPLDVASFSNWRASVNFNINSDVEYLTVVATNIVSARKHCQINCFL